MIVRAGRLSTANPPAQNSFTEIVNDTDISGSTKPKFYIIKSKKMFVFLSGLPAFLCGHNATLEEDGRFFTTRSDEVTLTYRREPRFDSENGGFVMKFVAFHTGTEFS